MELLINLLPPIIVIGVVFLLLFFIRNKNSKYMDEGMALSREMLEVQKQASQSLKEIKELMEKK